MDVISAVILGVIEGITEFLPISSTGHLILFSKLLSLPDGRFTQTFQIAIQSGAMAAVVLLYWKMLLSTPDVWKKVLVAFVPTGFAGFFLYPLFKSVFQSSMEIVLWSLFLGGAFLIFFEMVYQAKKSVCANLSEITYHQAFWIGTWQALAIIPGVSRSAASIVGGIVMNLDRKLAVEFSFLLAIPTIVIATAYDLLRHGSSFSLAEWDILFLGSVVSFFAALVGIKFLLEFIKKHNFLYFGFYRIALVLVFFLLFAISL